MARTKLIKSSKSLRKRCYSFEGLKGFRKFLQQKCTITHRRTDVVRRSDLHRAYQTFCAAEHHPVGSKVNVGRCLGGLHVWASTRLGGSNGRGQEYAYVGLCLKESSLKESPMRSPSPLSQPSSDPLRLSCTSSGDVSSSSLHSPEILPPSGNDCITLLDDFLREHVERTGSTEDAVPVEELHAAYRRLCKRRGVTPQSDTNLRSRVAVQEGVAISPLKFMTVKLAYQGLRWTTTALTALKPSTTPQSTPCNSCQAGQRATAATEGKVQVKNEAREGIESSGYWSPLVWEDNLEEQFSFFRDENDNSEELQSLQTASLPPQATITSLPTLPDLMAPQGTVDFSHLLDAYDSKDYCLF